MRFLKIFLICWFAFVAVFFLLTVMLNVFVGIDLSAYCTALMGITGIEAMASWLIGRKLTVSQVKSDRILLREINSWVKL